MKTIIGCLHWPRLSNQIDAKVGKDKHQLMPIWLLMYRASLLAFRAYFNTYGSYLLNLLNLSHISSIIFVLDHVFDHQARTSAAMQKFIKNVWSSAVIYNLYT